MLRNSEAFSGYSVDDIEVAREFYGTTLGLDVSMQPFGLELRMSERTHVYIYPKDNHEPATYTVLNFPVPDIEKAVAELTRAGVTFERYGEELGQDERGIARGEFGPPIAWFKDSAGNILSILEIQ